MVEIDIVALTNAIKEEIKNNSPEKSFNRLFNAGIIDENGDLTPYYRNDSDDDINLADNKLVEMAH